MEIGFVVDQMTTLGLVLMRITGILAVAFPFAGPLVPPVARGLFSLVMALVLLPVVELWPGGDGWGYAAAAAAELAVGLAVGLLSQLLFLAVQGAGDLIDIEMGFGMVHILDPQMGRPIPLMGSFLHVVAVLIFLTFNGHHHLLAAMTESFHQVPLGGPRLDQLALAAAVEQFGWIFATALRIALPVLAALFLTNLAFAILARTMPQLHVLIVGLPAKIAVGLLATLLVVPALRSMAEREWLVTISGVMDFIRALAP